MKCNFSLTWHETEHALEIVFAPAETDKPTGLGKETERSIELDCKVRINSEARVQSLVVPRHRLVCSQSSVPLKYAYDPIADCLAIDLVDKAHKNFAYTCPSDFDHDIIFDCTHDDKICAIEVLFVSINCCVNDKK